MSTFSVLPLRLAPLAAFRPPLAHGSRCSPFASRRSLRAAFRVARFARASIDRRFEETNPEYHVVFEPIDFTQWFNLTNEYREQGRYASAATVYRALVESLDDNLERVDGAYDHFSRAFSRALNGTSTVSRPRSATLMRLLTPSGSSTSGWHRERRFSRNTSRRRV